MTVINDYHRKVVRWISTWGLQYQEEYPVGPYSLDVYLPEMHLGLEIDGPWHNKKKDRKRDAAIKEQGIDIVRVEVGTPKAVLHETLFAYFQKEAERRAKTNGSYTDRSGD